MNETTTLEGKTPWDFACAWYDVDEIHRSIKSGGLSGGPGHWLKIPDDTNSREFAGWLAHQYRLAMRKGIELGQSSRTATPAPSEPAAANSFTFEPNIPCAHCGEIMTDDEWGRAYIRAAPGEPRIVKHRACYCYEQEQPTEPACRMPSLGADCHCPVCNAKRKPSEPPAAHPEDTCERCGSPNITWFVQSPLWNKYARDYYSIVCPICFAKMAEDAGFVPTSWQLVPENPPSEPPAEPYDHEAWSQEGTPQQRPSEPPTSEPGRELPAGTDEPGVWLHNIHTATSTRQPMVRGRWGGCKVALETERELAEKDTLTKDDPIGWYLCKSNTRGSVVDRAYWWNGTEIRGYDNGHFLVEIGNHWDFRGPLSLPGNKAADGAWEIDEPATPAPSEPASEPIQADTDIPRTAGDLAASLDKHTRPTERESIPLGFDPDDSEPASERPSEPAVGARELPDEFSTRWYRDEGDWIVVTGSDGDGFLGFAGLMFVAGSVGLDLPRGNWHKAGADGAGDAAWIKRMTALAIEYTRVIDQQTSELTTANATIVAFRENYAQMKSRLHDVYGALAVRGGIRTSDGDLSSQPNFHEDLTMTTSPERREELRQLAKTPMRELIAREIAEAIPQLLSDIEAVERENDLLTSNFATCCDLLNTWSRELGIDECRDPYADLAIRNHIDKIWGEVSGRHHKQLSAVERERDELRKRVLELEDGIASDSTGAV